MFFFKSFSFPAFNLLSHLWREGVPLTFFSRGTSVAHSAVFHSFDCSEYKNERLRNQNSKHLIACQRVRIPATRRDASRPVSPRLRFIGDWPVAGPRFALSVARSRCNSTHASTHCACCCCGIAINSRHYLARTKAGARTALLFASEIRSFLVFKCIPVRDKGDAGERETERETRVTRIDVRSLVVTCFCINK